MSRLRAWLMRFAGLFSRPRRDGELAAELESHLEMHIEDNIRAGMTPEEARRQALIKLGGVEQTKENYRERRGIPWLESLWQDVRFGVRMLRKNPGFTAVAVLTLALGIGANTAIFSVVNAVLLRPLPYEHPESLVQVWNTYLPVWPQLGISPGDFQDFRRQTKKFSEMAAYINVPQGFNMTGRREPQRVQAAFASSNLLSVLGIRPDAGRDFSTVEDQAGSAPVMLISHDLWQNSFDADSAVVGRTFDLDGRGYTLIGVLPASFRLVSSADVWLPLGQYADDLNGRIHHPYNAIARLTPGATILQAQAEMATLNRQEALAFPDAHTNWGVVVQRMEDPSAAKMRLALLVLLGAVALVLLIACANIMNLLLARNAARRREIGLRIALGASRLRLVRQLLTESLLLSLLGGVLGILLAVAGLRSLRGFVPADLAPIRGAALNGWVLGFTIFMCFLTGIICGLVPAHQTLRVDLNSVLKEGDRISGASGSRKLRSILVVSEIAFALIPLVGAGLLIRVFIA